MPLPPEWPRAHLRSVRFGLADFSLHVTRPRRASSTMRRTPHNERILPIDQLVDVVAVLNCTASVHPVRSDSDPIGPLYGELKCSSEPTGFAARLSRLGDAGPRAELQPDSSQTATCPRPSEGATCGTRCRRKAGRTVPRA